MARQAAGGRDDEGWGLTGGLAGRLVERAIENPAASGGLVVMALTASAIVINASFLQPGDHPRPHLAPRSIGAASSTPPTPTPRLREIPGTEAQRPSVLAPAGTAAAPSLGIAKPAGAAGTKAVAAQPAADPDVALVADVQRELTRIGLYAGPIDGVPGPRTKTAIAAYQAAAGISANGAASAELLTLTRRSAPPTKAAATTSQPKSTPIPPATIPATLPAPAAARPAPIAAVIAEADSASAENIRRVQLALNQIGYGVIPIDGKAGKETADAIRRFELDYGLPVTGQPNETVIKRLVAIGALAAR